MKSFYLTIILCENESFTKCHQTTNLRLLLRINESMADKTDVKISPFFIGTQKVKCIQLNHYYSRHKLEHPPRWLTPIWQDDCSMHILLNLFNSCWLLGENSDDELPLFVGCKCWGHNDVRSRWKFLLSWYLPQIGEVSCSK